GLLLVRSAAARRRRATSGRPRPVRGTSRLDETALAAADPVPGAAEPLVERDLRPPAQRLLDLRDVEGAPPQIALARGLHPRRLLAAGDRSALRMEVCARRLAPAPDVEASAGARRDQHRRDDVVDVDEVARLAAVSEDDRLAAFRHRLQE